MKGEDRREERAIEAIARVMPEVLFEDQRGFSVWMPSAYRRLASAALAAAEDEE